MRITLITFGAIIKSTQAHCSEEERRLWRNNMEFSNRMDSYARRNLGNGDHVTTKLLRDYHPDLSLHCAACHGGTVSCGTKHCWAKCLFSSTAPGCQDCTRRECLASYMECIGTNTEDDLPPKPIESTSTTTTTPVPLRTRAARSSTTTVAPTSSDAGTSFTLSSELVTP